MFKGLRFVSILLISFGVLFAQNNTLRVVVDDSIRTVTHCASGSLYGITETLPTNIDEVIKPLKPNVFVQPAKSGHGYQQPIGNAFVVADRIKNTTGKVQIRLADVLPGWPYQWKNQEHWLNTVQEIVQQKLSSDLQNFDGYEIWNEPYGTWKDENGDFHTVLWKPTFDLIKSLDPTAKIIGPSFSYYHSERMSKFLDFAKANNCLPEVISWHQWGAEGFTNAVENYRQLEANKGISKRAISINEYSSTTHEYEGSPGISVPFIAKFERHGVESAMISWWFTNLPGRLGSLLTAKNEKGGGWWLYKWYGEMQGYMAKVVPPNDKSDGLDGFAAVDKENNLISIVVGGNTVGNVQVRVENIFAILGDSIDVLAEFVPWVNKDSAVLQTELINDLQYQISNNVLTINLNIASKFHGYRILLSSAEPAVVVPAERDSIFNGDFATGAAGWTLNVWAGEAQGSVKDEEYQVVIQEIGTEKYQIQLIQAGLRLERDQWYQISFDAYALAPRFIEVNVEQHESPWDSYLDQVQEFSLSISKTEQVFNFLMPTETDKNSRLSFNLGGETGTVFIDNVSLRKIEAPTGVKPTIKNKSQVILNQGVLSIDGARIADLQCVEVINLQGERLAVYSKVNHEINLGFLAKGLYVVKFKYPNWHHSILVVKP